MDISADADIAIYESHYIIINLVCQADFTKPEHPKTSFCIPLYLSKTYCYQKENDKRNRQVYNNGKETDMSAGADTANYERLLQENRYPL